MRKIAIVTSIAFLGLTVGLPTQLGFTVGLHASLAADTNPGHWPEWRGPYRNGMARGDAPTTWSDTKNIKWKTEIPGRGFSTPVIWGDKVFLTTAVQTAKSPEPSPTPTRPPQHPGAPPEAPTPGAQTPDGAAGKVDREAARADRSNTSF